MASNPMPPGRMRGWVDAIAGFPIFRSKTSIRAGSGTLSSLDGFDGLITADGATAGIVFRNRANAAQYGQLYRTGTTYHIDDEGGNPRWQWDYTELAWAAPTLLNSWVNFGGGFNNAGYRKDHSGFVHLRGLIKGGTATLGTVLFTLPSAFRPTSGTHIFTVSSNSAFGECRVDTSGNVMIQIGSNAFFSLDGIHFDTAT